MRAIFDFDTVARKIQIKSDFLPEIREHFSVENKATIFVRRRYGRNVATRKYAITNKGHIDAPFCKQLCKELKQTFPHLLLEFTDKALEYINSNKLSDSIDSLNLTPRDYQIESAKKALIEGRGIIVLPTSAGKTLTIALMVNSILRNQNYKVLILVPNIQLVEQTYQDFIDYGLDQTTFSRWTGGHGYTSTNIVIANSQILLSEKQDTTVLKEFDCIVVDECHKLATADKIAKLIKNLKCKHLFGFTGSLPNDKFDVWTLNRLFGSVLYHKQSIELRNDKFITSVRVVALELTYNNVPEFTRPSMSEPTAGYEEEITWLHTNEFRNSVISKLIQKLDTNTLILVDRIAHGEFLLEYLKTTTNKQIYFIHGSVDIEEREQLRKLMEETNGVVCIAISKIFSTGISIKNLHNVIFAAIGKARIKIIQSIGRSLRLHHSKDIATIFDIADVSLHYGQKHFIERKDLYESEKIPLISKQLVENN